MRRTMIIGSTLAVLVGAASAFAAMFNSYELSRVTFSPKGAGTSAQPRIVNISGTLRVSAPAHDRPAPLTEIKVQVYGLRTNGSLFPTCTDRRIMANLLSYEQACPLRSRIAQGNIHGLLGPASDPSASQGTTCNPYLKVFNGGSGTQVFFFTTTTHTPNPRADKCAGFPTGATAPFDGHISYQGKWWVLTVPLPADVSTSIANTPGLYGSLISEVLSPISETTKVAGKTRAYMESVACKGHTRPYSVTFTASQYNTGTPETQTVSGSAPC